MAQTTSSRITLDASMWPFVLCTIQGVLTDDDFKGLFHGFDDLYARREPFHIVNMAVGAWSLPSASQRRLIADLARSHEAMSRRWCLGGASVVENGVARGLIKAICWMSPPAYKLTLHATLEEAIDEAFRTFELNRIVIPLEARRYRASVPKKAKTVPPNEETDPSRFT